MSNSLKSVQKLLGAYVYALCLADSCLVKPVLSTAKLYQSFGIDRTGPMRLCLSMSIGKLAQRYSRYFNFNSVETKQLCLSMSKQSCLLINLLNYFNAKIDLSTLIV